MNINSNGKSRLKRIAKAAKDFVRAIIGPALLCAFLWLQAASAANQVQTNVPNKSEDSPATTEMLIRAIRNGPRDGTSLVIKGASANQSGGSNLTQVEAAKKLEATPLNMAAAASNLSGSGTTNSAFVLDDKHKLAIGDILSFRILEDEEDVTENSKEARKPFFVTDSGDLEVPYIGRVHAENKTCRQLAAEIKTALEKEYYYQATVIIAVDVMTKSHGRVYLVGAVRLPGPVDIPSDEILTLSKAVLRAGSFTDYADRRHVKVTRKGAVAKDDPGKDDKKTFVVDVGEIFDKGKIETDLSLEPGDLIFVPDRLIRF